MGEATVMMLELGKLAPNSYNPRKRMGKKHLASLRRSLERDGQLQTLLVRPLDSGKFEVVAGMRRYLSLKDLYGDRTKVACTVQEMDDATAVKRAFKENVERETLTPIDEAGWFFNMLGLTQEQLFTYEGHGTGGQPGAAGRPLPSRDNPEVRRLAEELDVSPNLIETRLPVLALPSELQELSMQTYLGEAEDGLGVEKAGAIARLRLIGDKDEAHKQMLAVWKQWGRKDLEELNSQVSNILESYRKKADEVLRELGTLEKNLKKRVEELRVGMERVSRWLDPKAKDSLFGLLPKSLTEALVGLLPKKLEEPEDTFETLDDLVTKITRDNTLSETEEEFRVKLNNLYTGKKSLHDGECAYCGTNVDSKRLESRIESIEKGIDEVEKQIKLKDKLRNQTEQVKRDLGLSIRQFEDVKSKYQAALKTLVEAKKITKTDADTRLQEVLGE